MNYETCRHSESVLVIKLISTGRRDNFYPKFVPQLKKSCQDCHKFLGFEKQTPELIGFLNNKLADFAIKI